MSKKLPRHKLRQHAITTKTLLRRVLKKPITKSNANRRLPRQILIKKLVATSYDDARRYHPEGKQRPLKKLNGGVAKPLPQIGPSRAYKNPYLQNTPMRAFAPQKQKAFRPIADLSVRYHAPPDATLCVRRKIRREVIHAYKLNGRSGQKKPNRGPRSTIVCPR